MTRALPAAALSLGILLASAAAGSANPRQGVSFDRLMEEAGLRLVPTLAMEEIAPPATSLFTFQKAYRHKLAPFEVWYAVRPLSRVEIKYDDPHSSAPNPDHVFPLVFQTLIGKLARHGHSPTRVYPPEKARAIFNADWAAAALFDADPALGSKYAQAMLFAYHKNGKGDAYALFLFDDPKAAKPLIDILLDDLRFADD
ncbi:MAG: hypothetical protein D6773_10790 [Alphaproteobacteria bacterium]|nr:MAG: hypothetical protein D6773_10790 [Alphaproteobacteria bacterium]